MSGTTGTGKGLVLLSPTVEMLSDVSAPAANNGDVLTWQSSTSQWVAAAPAAGSGTVTSVSAGIGLTASVNPITSAGSIQLANTSVSAGLYTRATITVDAQGRLTAAADGALQTITLAGDVSGAGTAAISAVVVAIQNTQVSAGTIGNNQVLTYIAGKGKWTPRAVAGSGTVTSIGVSGKSGIAVSGSPVTSSGIISLTLGAITPSSINTAGIVSAASLNVTGDVLAAGGRVTASAATITGLLTGATATFSGIVSANAGVKGTTGSFSGIVSAVGLVATTGSFSGVVSANAGLASTTGSFSSLLTGATATFSGIVSANAGLVGTTGSFSGVVSAVGLVATTGSFSGVVSANAGLKSTTGNFSGLVSADSGVSTTIVSCIRIIPVIVSVAYNGTTTVDASQSSYFRGVAVSAFTLSANNAQDGQKIVYEIIQDSTGSRLITLGALFALGTDITVTTLSTAANKRDFLGTFYNGTTNKHYVTAFVKGY